MNMRMVIMTKVIACTPSKRQSVKAIEKFPNTTRKVTKILIA